jgi:hypothetical protein
VDFLEVVNCKFDSSKLNMGMTGIGK